MTDALAPGWWFPLRILVSTPVTWISLEP
jgi:hypothetical protein